MCYSKEIGYQPCISTTPVVLNSNFQEPQLTELVKNVRKLLVHTVEIAGLCLNIPQKTR